MRSLVFVLPVLLFFSCKSKQEVAKQEESPTKATQQVMVEQPIANETQAPIGPESEFASKEAYEEFQANQRKMEMMQEMGVKHPDWADSIIVAIERTACFGSCPSYRFTISKNGYAFYKGFAFVDKEGDHTARVDQSTISNILEAAQKTNYFDLDEFYWEPITDVPTTYTTIVKNAQRFNVLNQSEAPQSLIDFELFLDDVIAEIDWKKQAK